MGRETHCILCQSRSRLGAFPQDCVADTSPLRALATILLESLAEWKEQVTYDATRFIDHEETPLGIVQYDLDRSGGDGRFMPMNDVP